MDGPAWGLNCFYAWRKMEFISSQYSGGKPFGNHIASQTCWVASAPALNQQV